MPYLDKIFRISEPYLKKLLTPREYQRLILETAPLKKKEACEAVAGFSSVYRNIIKEKHQSAHSFDPDFTNRLYSNNGKIKAVWGSCLDALSRLKSESVHLMVTSPPYYNAREYSQWDTLDSYLHDMRQIVKESYRVIDNHRTFVFNVGDITGNDNRHTKSSWGSRRIPLGAYFIQIFEGAGFRFVDDFIWDKGQVQSQRQKNGDTPNPLYQYPMNCYEHIMVFQKHRQDETQYPCPVCGCLKVNGNAYSGVGIRSWECKNLECFSRSAANRGKRFSLRSIVMDELKVNEIDKDFIKKWRRDIIKINPTIKINCKGENILGHTAPFPADIPAFAVEMFTGIGEIVIDPFAGSFTSMIEAANRGRVSIGIEQDVSIKKSVVANLKRHGLKAEHVNAR